MAGIDADFLSDDHDPIDLVETLAQRHAWDFDRISDEQIAMAIEGVWRTYSISLAWSAYDETLRIMWTFDLDPPKEREQALYHALDRANDKCWTGCFTLWPEQKLMVYRYGLNLVGGAGVSAAQIDAMVQAAVFACERFYPAFQLVCWGDEHPVRAMDIAMNEAYGTA